MRCSAADFSASSCSSSSSTRARSAARSAAARDTVSSAAPSLALRSAERAASSRRAASAASASSCASGVAAAACLGNYYGTTALYEHALISHSDPYNPLSIRASFCVAETTLYRTVQLALLCGELRARLLQVRFRAVRLLLQHRLRDRDRRRAALRSLAGGGGGCELRAQGLNLSSCGVCWRSGT